MNHFQFQYQSFQKNQLHFPIFLRSPPPLSRRTRSQVRDARRQSGTGLSIYMYRGVRNDRSESMRPCIRVESVRDVPKEQTSDHVSFPSPSLEAWLYIDGDAALLSYHPVSRAPRLVIGFVFQNFSNSTQRMRLARNVPCIYIYVCVCVCVCTIFERCREDFLLLGYNLILSDPLC